MRRIVSRPLEQRIEPAFGRRKGLRNNDADPPKTRRANRDEKRRHRLDAIREVLEADPYQIAARERCVYHISIITPAAADHDGTNRSLGPSSLASTSAKE